jgi:hypothetical protein
MRINDLIVESKNKVDEAPMGALGRIGNKLATKTAAIAPTFAARATGKLETGKTANELRRLYDVYLGKTNQETSSESLLAFLKSRGYPTSGVEQMLKGPQGPGTDPGQTANKAASDSPAPQGRIDPTMDEPPVDANNDGKPDEPAADANNDGKPDELDRIKSLAGVPNNDADAKPNFSQGNYGSTTTNAPAGIPNPAAGQLPSASAAADPKADTDKDGTPDATDTDDNNDGKPDAPVTGQALGPKGRETLGRLGKAKQGRENPGQGTLDLNSVSRTGNSIIEGAIDDATVDKALLRVVADAEKMGMGQELGDPDGPQGPMTAPAGGGQQGSAQQQGNKQGMASRFAQGFSQGMQGQTGTAADQDDQGEKKGSLNFQQMGALLPGIDQNQLRMALSTALRGGDLNRNMINTLSQAMVEIVKMDPQKTTAIMNQLKKVSVQ